MRARWLAVAAAVALGCGRQPRGQGVPTVDLTVPAIASLGLGCDPDRSRWLLRVEATSWTGGGTLHLTEDGDYVESHRVPSLEAAPDGTWDHLETILQIQPDWRAVREGSSTAFLCTSRLFSLFELLDLDQERVDCWQRGDPALWAGVTGIPLCGSDLSAR